MGRVIGTTHAYDSITNKNLNTQRASGMPTIGDNGNKLAITTTNISVFSNNMRIGFVQSFSPQESRTITKLQELGTEGVVQSVAGNTNGGQLTLSRFALYNSNLFNAIGLTRTGRFVDPSTSTYGPASRKDSIYQTYGNPFKTLKDQRVPLELVVKIRKPSEETEITTETYIDCWLSSYSKSIASSTITITEQATIFYSDVI